MWIESASGYVDLVAAPSMSYTKAPGNLPKICRPDFLQYSKVHPGCDQLTFTFRDQGAIDRWQEFYFLGWMAIGGNGNFFDLYVFDGIGILPIKELTYYANGDHSKYYPKIHSLIFFKVTLAMITGDK